MPKIATVSGCEIHVYAERGRHHRPHVHVVARDWDLSISIMEQEILAGDFPNSKIANSVTKYIDAHTNDLLQVWDDWND